MLVDTLAVASAPPKKVRAAKPRPKTQTIPTTTAPSVLASLDLSLNWALTSLVGEVYQHVGAHDLGSVVFDSGSQVLNFVNRQRYSPTKPLDPAWFEAPDLAIAFLNSNDKAEVVEQWEDARLKAKAAQVWLVDSQSRSIRVVRQDGTVQRLAHDQTLDGEDVLSGFHCQVASVLPTCQNEPQSGPWTVEAFEQYPKAKEFELVNGFLVERLPMSAAANWAKSKLAGALHVYGCQSGLGHGLSEMDYNFQLAQKNTVRIPDASFVLQNRVPATVGRTGPFPVVPDLAAEVVSPNDLAVELEAKIDLYLKAGVSLVWIIYPDTKSALVIRQNGMGLRLLNHQELDGETLLPGFRCPLASLFLS